MHQRNAVPLYEERIFYGRLLNIYEVPFPPAPHLHHPNRTKYLLARILPCPITPGPVPNTVSYKTSAHERAPIEVVDLGTICAVVGRLLYQGRTYIIDRQDGSTDCVIPDADS